MVITQCVQLGATLICPGISSVQLSLPWCLVLILWTVWMWMLLLCLRLKDKHRRARTNTPTSFSSRIRSDETKNGRATDERNELDERMNKDNNDARSTTTDSIVGWRGREKNQSFYHGSSLSLSPALCYSYCTNKKLAGALFSLLSLTLARRRRRGRRFKFCAHPTIECACEWDTEKKGKEQVFNETHRSGQQLFELVAWRFDVYLQSSSFYGSVRGNKTQDEGVWHQQAERRPSRSWLFKSTACDLFFFT